MKLNLSKDCGQNLNSNSEEKQGTKVDYEQVLQWTSTKVMLFSIVTSYTPKHCNYDEIKFKCKPYTDRHEIVSFIITILFSSENVYCMIPFRYYLYY